MRYTLIWKPSALAQLADVWLKASNRQAVNDAVAKIEGYLRRSSTTAGSEHIEGTRLVVLPPLVAGYEIFHDDCRVDIVSVHYRP